MDVAKRGGNHAFWRDDVSITDVYLLAMAVAHGGGLVTFDQRVQSVMVKGSRPGASGDALNRARRPLRLSGTESPSPCLRESYRPVSRPQGRLLDPTDPQITHQPPHGRPGARERVGYAGYTLFLWSIWRTIFLTGPDQSFGSYHALLKTEVGRANPFAIFVDASQCFAAEPRIGPGPKFAVGPCRFVNGAVEVAMIRWRIPSDAA